MVTFKYVVFFLHIFFYCSECYELENVTFPGYSKWTPSTSDRNDLFCPDDCSAKRKSAECCACDALPCWKINAEACGVSVEELYIEYTDPFGNASLVGIDAKTENTTLYVLKHTNGRLKTMPDNICSYADSLVEIDLRNNFIVDIEVIKCLKRLDILILDHNKITQIPNNTFAGMESLRHLSLAYNELLDLPPFTTKLQQGNIFNVDFSYNVFRDVDITNILVPGEFCKMQFIGVEIERQTNNAGFALEEGVIHGPGNIDFTSSKGKTWINATALGLSDYSEFGKYFDATLEWDNSSVHCDCNIVPFLRDLGEEASRYWPQLEFDFVCESPDRMKGVSLTQIFSDSSYDDLTCDLEVCPSGCSCADRQNQDIVAVNCNGLTRFPDMMPVGYWGNDQLELNLDGNNITDLPNRDYLSRVSVLKLSGNALEVLDADAIDALPDDVKIDISNHELERIPDTFYQLDPDKIDFGINPIICDCDNLWIGEWILLRAKNSSLQCKTSISNNVVDASLVTSDYLSCPKPPFPWNNVIWSLAVGIMLLIAAALFSYLFHYEIFLLKRRATFKQNKAVRDEYKFDIFISFSGHNNDVYSWVNSLLRPYLIDRYSCFFPHCDISPGDDRMGSAGEAIEKSRNYIIVLCEEYLKDENSYYEFDTLWKHFSKDTNKQIIVINYDPMASSEIVDKRLRAFTRINYDLNFKDRETKFLVRLEKRLGTCRRENQTIQSSNEFNLESLSIQDLTLPEVPHRSHGGRMSRLSARYKEVKKGTKRSSKNFGADVVTEIHPNMPEDTEPIQSPPPAYSQDDDIRLSFIKDRTNP